MAGHQLKENIVENSLQASVKDESVECNENSPQSPRNLIEDKSGSVPLNGCKAEHTEFQQGREQSSSSETDWTTTTDTSIHSSASEQDVSQEVLHMCDGMDEMSLASPPAEASGRDQGRGRVRGYKQGASYRVSNKNKPAPVKYEPASSASSSSSGSSRSSSADSNSDSESSGGSHSSYTSEDSYSHSSHSSHSTHSSHSSEGSCSECNEGCSCSCHDEDPSSASSTSYESNDDVTGMPRGKRGQLGRKGVKKLAEQCAQS